MSDTRTIIGVTKPFASDPDPAKSGEIHVQLSDGSDYESAGIVDREENGVGVQRVELRTAAGLIDGPVYTDYVCYKMRMLGAIVPDVGAPPPTVIPAAPIPHTSSVSVSSLPTTGATPQQAASRTHTIISALLGILHIATNPAVSAFLPPQYRAVVTAIGVVDTVVEGAAPAPASP